MIVTHTKVCLLPDDPGEEAAGGVVISDWNADHTITGAGREVLTARRTFYVRTDGSDSNNGLTNSSGGAFLTIQHAIDVAKTLDKSSFGVEINVAAGTYVGDVLCVDHEVTGRAHTEPTIKIVGDVASRTSRVIDGRFEAWGAGSIALIGLSITKTVWGFSRTNINAYSCRLNGFYSGTNAVLYAESCETLAGEFGSAFEAHEAGILTAYLTTVIGTPAFAVAFASASSSGYIAFYDQPVGAATGSRYKVRRGGIIDCYGGGESYLPGDAAGTVATGGLYLGAGYVNTPSTTVASLVAASTAGAGARAFVTDATATTFLSTVAGGGANKVPVVSDGTNWLIG